MNIKYIVDKESGVKEINLFNKKEGEEKDLKKFVNVNYQDFLESDVEGEEKNSLKHRKFILLVREIIKKIKENKIEKVQIDYQQIKDLKVEDLSDLEKIKLFIENLIIGEYKFDRYFSKKDGRIAELLIVGNFTDEEKAIFKKGEVIGDSVNWARELANTPGNDMTPSILTNEVKKRFQEKEEVKIEIIEEDDARKLGMNLFLSVGEGSEEKSKFIVLKYFGSNNKEEQPIVLVGKGVTFDTGGTNLKPSDYILGMNMDMTGAAVVLASFDAAVNLKSQKNLIVLVPAVENSISGKATRPGDIIKSFSGKTVEIQNTDAEGRLILADAITYAKQFRPKIMIDVATLTGASLIAVGQRATVIMSNAEDLNKEIQKIGEKNGDYFWPLPLWEEFEENMKSKVADLSNLADVRYGGTITAGIFLYQFVKDLIKENQKLQWAHLDIAPRMEAIKADKLEYGATGEPVRTLTEFIL